jgi:hypothetical protein
MRPVRTVAAVLFVAAIAITGCAAHSAVQPSPAPSPPVVEPAPLPVADGLAPAPAPAPKPPVLRAPVLADGQYDAYITRVDSRQRRLVVDVVQVFHDARAVKEAVADGKSPAEAKYLTTWVRNQNPRLRTLPLAGDVQVKLRDTCGEGGGDRDAQLTRLAANARLNGTYYYTLTVDDGTVERIQERLAVNAC